ncbi:hypothetical protein F5Y08DRAFT_302993 [Xylaria arbuscula]|nr:hypothetical protein F5Y08DRAFT_302993 [Xylaria arbuscula]
MAADPIGVVGTADGVVSLGLQLYGTLKQYTDDFNSRDDRIIKTLSYLGQLKETLDIIGAANQSLKPTHQASSDVITSCLRSCNAEMVALQQKLQEYGLSQLNTVEERLKDVKKKFKYPFGVARIEEIQKYLGRIIDTLLLVVHGLELHSHLKISANIDYLNDSINRQGNLLAKIESDIDISQKVNTANASQLTSINTSIQPLQPLIQGLESVTKERFDKFENQMHTNHSITTSRLDVLESQSKAMTEILNILKHSEDRSLPTHQEHIEKRLVLSLVSKPSLLRDVQESLDFHDEVKSTSDLSTSILEGPDAWWTKPPLGGLRPCSCGNQNSQRPPRASIWRSVNKRVTHRYPFRFFSEETIKSNRHSGCSHYTSNASDHTKMLETAFMGLHRLFSAAVSVGLCLRHGAGGASISPMFRYRYMVDEWQSPPFRILRLFKDAIYYRLPMSYSESSCQTIVISCLSWIATSYDRQVASPRDVISNDFSSIDYFLGILPSSFSRKEILPLINGLLDLGVIPAHPQLVGDRHSWQVHVPRVLSLILLRLPILTYQYQATAINLSTYGDAVCKSSELCAAVEPDLDLVCTALLHKDRQRLSEVLAAKSLAADNCRPKVSFIQLIIRWPEGLKHIFETQPDFFDPAHLTEIFQNILSSYPLLRARFGDCHISILMDVLLVHNCPLTENDVSFFILRVTLLQDDDCYSLQTVLQHLKSWRQRLRETVETYLPIMSENLSTHRDSEVLDFKAYRAISELQTIGLDPYKMFDLQQDDYRLGVPNRSIYHLIRTPEQAQVAFDLGFRDIDVEFEGTTPLLSFISCYDYLGDAGAYLRWLIDHNANYTRESQWKSRSANHSPHTMDAPRYRVVHWMFRCLGQEVRFDSVRTHLNELITSMTQSPWAANLTPANCYDGCSCACLSSLQGCSPSMIYLNGRVSRMETNKYRAPLGVNALMQDLNTLVQATGPFSITVECIIRCLTFQRLGIRHTCCASVRDMYYPEKFPLDYGSDFKELKEEDKDRIHQLNELVAQFLEQYNNSGQTLEDFMTGPWGEEILRIEEEEENKRWTAQETDRLLSIGVMLEDDVESAESSSAEDEEGGDRSQPEYWSKQFEIIVNGGRSVEECW